MKCKNCGNEYYERLECLLCNYFNAELMKAEEEINSIGYFDQKIKVLLRGLILQKIKIIRSDQGGPGHLKHFPWVEIDEKDKEKVNLMIERYNHFHGKNSGCWKIERYFGRFYWIVPEKKELPLSILHHQLRLFGWFLHYY